MQKACKVVFAITSFSALQILLYINIADIDRDGPVTDHIKSYSNQRLNNNITTALPRHPAKTQQLERLEERLQTRTDVLMAECKKLRNNKSEPLENTRLRLNHIVVNDIHEVLYCYVPKVACTNLKRLFLILTGQIDVKDPLQISANDVHFRFNQHLTYLDKFSQAEVDYRVNHYKKVIFVREPLERLLSAYRDKFETRDYIFTHIYAKHIIKMFRKNPLNNSLETEFDVSFPEFVDYITHVDPYLFDEHWDSYYNLCSPCYIKYDFIGKYETLDEDVDLLLKQISVDHVIKFPKRNETYKTLRTEDTMNDFYAEINPEKIQKLHETYSTDYSMFGYKLKDGLRQFLNSTV